MDKVDRDFRSGQTSHRKGRRVPFQCKVNMAVTCVNNVEAWEYKLLRYLDHHLPVSTSCLMSHPKQVPF